MNQFDRKGPLTPREQFYRERHGIHPGKHSAHVIRGRRTRLGRFKQDVAITFSERPWTPPQLVRLFTVRSWRRIISGRRLTKLARRNGVQLP